MINEEATFKQCGYHSYDLKPKSHKKIIAVCDDCGKVRISSKYHYHARCKSCANKCKYLSEGTRKKMSDAKKGELHPNWKNGASFEPYCEKFNDEFKEDIRDKFGRICFLCPKTEEENGKKLSVHHVNYNKNCGCDGDETCQFVPLCIGCNAKVNFNRDMWEKKIKDMMKNTLNGWYKPEYLPIS